MNEKKQVNGLPARTMRLLGSVAFVILTAVVYLLLLDSPLLASPPMPNGTGEPAIISLTGLGEGEIPLDLQNVQFVGTFENSQVASDENGSAIYVKADATGTNSGTSWADAYTDLQTALAAAHSGDAIWVTAGTYKPTTGTDRTATYQLRNGVILYGGFAGGETSRDQRDWEANVTILSGEVGVVGDNSDNSHTVVTGSGTDETAVLDGFTVTGGNARDGSGGGMYNNGGSPTLANCTFTGNSGNYGGGMYNWYSNPTLTNVTFSGNFARSGGGGMYNDESNPVLTNCTFNGNSATYGGGMHNKNRSTPTLTNCTFSANSAGAGGGMHNSWTSPILTNCTFNANSAHRGGGMYSFGSKPTLRNTIVANSLAGGNCFGSITSEGYNLDSDGTCGFTRESDLSNIDPLLGPLQDNGGPTLTHVLLPGSLAIDGGNPARCTDPWGNPLATDQRGRVRPTDGDYDGIPVCDIGAYEADGQTVGEWRDTRDTTIQATGAYTVCLPLVHKHRPPEAKLGVDFGEAWVVVPEVIEYDFPVAREMGAGWMRVFLPWLGVETSPGEYDWDKYDPVFSRLGELGFDAIAVIYGAPDWAAEESCGPISDTVALESFLEVAVPRYAEVVDAWEFINEPDGRAPRPSYGPAVGCWGLYPAEYARQLGIFYATIKNLDPDALVFFGGLAYDYWERFEKDFFEKALQNGAGRYFDGVSLHHYPVNEAEFPTMASKVNEIRDTMSRNEIYWKRIWITETGQWVNMGRSVELQRDFIVRELTRGFGAGVDNIFWFDPREHEAWPWGGEVERYLISTNHEPMNGYTTFQHFANKLEGMHCLGAYQDVPDGIEAYKFVGTKGLLYILWSNTITKTVGLPSAANAVLTNRDGDETVIVPAQMGMVEFEVGVKPVFVEMADSEQQGNQ